jgi:hypothetical protein
MTLCLYRTLSPSHYCIKVSNHIHMVTPSYQHSIQPKPGDKSDFRPIDDRGFETPHDAVCNRIHMVPLKTPVFSVNSTKKSNSSKMVSPNFSFPNPCSYRYVLCCCCYSTLWVVPAPSPLSNSNFRPQPMVLLAWGGDAPLQHVSSSSK